MQNRTHPSFLLLLVLALPPKALHAQQDEIPPTVEGPTGTSPEGTRIVDGRPRFHFIKQVGHPISWVEAGFRPLLRLAAKAAPGGKDPEKKTPRVSGIKLGAEGFGAGSGFGPEVKLFHRDLFGTGIEVEVPVAITYKRYQSAAFLVNFPLISGDSGSDRLGLEVVGRYLSRPSDAFYGLGNDSSLSNLSRFRTVSRTAGGAINVRVGGSWSTRVETVFRSVGITEPRSSTSALDAFAGQGIPGLSTGATMIATTASLQRDTRDSAGLPDSGGLQRAEVSLNEGVGGGDYSYWRYRLELQQVIRLGDRKVLDFRGDLETNQAKGGSVVPFFDFPTLGSRSTVRGFQTRRFTDRSAMTASAEYRYRIWRYFDWGLFIDGGQVAPEIADFTREKLHFGYGTRFIARSKGEGKDRRFVSVDVAHSREGWRFYVDFGGVL